MVNLKLVFSILVTALISYPTLAQTGALKLFIECDCDKNYMRQEIPYVDHVRDQGLAEVQLFIYDIGMANGGRNFTLDFQGLGLYDKISNRQVFETTAIMSNDEVRRGLVKKIGLGLLPFLLKSDNADRINFTVEMKGSTEDKLVDVEEDPWSRWLFEASVDGQWEKETSRSNFELEIGFEADRVTEEWRIRNDLEFNQSGSMFERDGEEFKSNRKRYGYEGSVVKSLTDHWSIGISQIIKHDTYENQNIYLNLRPALEYNFFPYHQVLRREITIAYKIGYIYANYLERTVFNRDKESLYNHALDIEMKFRQPWGDISTNLEASAYLHDFSKNRLVFDSELSVRIYKGLSVSFSTDLQLIRDQLNLPAGDASLEDVLLKQKQIATDFETSFSVGISYTFGSAFNNIINTRL